MARIELRDATIRIKDGMKGTAKVADASIAGGNTTLEIDTLAGLPNARTTVPVGTRFTIAGVTETYTVTAANNNEQQEVTVGTNNDGTFTLSFDGQVTTPLDHDASAATIQAALENLSNIGEGDVVVTGGTGPWVIEFRGQYAGVDVPALVIDGTSLSGGSGEAVTVLHEGGTTWELTFSPALDGNDLPSDDDDITFLPIQIEIKVGEGNLTYTESKEYTYQLDRGDLDTVREGNQVPLELNLEFVYEFVTTGTSEAVTPVDALKQKNGAADWNSSSDDPCEPYAVDIEIEHDPPCGSAESEITLFPDFRYDSLEFDLSAATISVTGRCNATEPIVTRI